MDAVVRRLRGASRRADDGFSMLEVIVALGLLLIVLSAASMLFIRSAQATNVQQQRQAAAVLADQGLEIARAYKPADMLNGWTQADIDNQWASPGIVDLSNTKKPTATAPTSTKNIQPTTNQTVSGTKYTVKTFIGDCWTPKVIQPTGDDVSCQAMNTSGYVHLYRVAVSVSWQGQDGVGCTGANGVCSVTASTLVDPSGDPTFNSNS